ncbi:MAG: leucine-rich repeat protein, partial [Bacteroidales bacterium]|nr:leucine-rich repeat protein [Bacteroidales bacterium]
YVDNGSALVFKWAAGDTLGIFPNKGNQVEFPITSQESSTSATFDGGGWALRNNASYAAYYPFSVWNYFQDNKTVIMDYSGQVQNGNGSFAHLSAYDYLASAKTTPQNNMVTFQMDRQGAILYIDIVVPEPAAITSLTISCDEAIFVEKAALDISGNNPVVTPIEIKESLTLNFENTITTEQNETVRAYMAVQPLDFSGKTVTATLRTNAGTYSAPVVSRVVNKGKAAFLRFSDNFTTTAHEAVDLGLTSGLEWASFNLGASAPEEYGDYFAWGETEPYYSSQDPLTWKTGKTGYNWASYKWCNGSDNKLTKYCTDSSYGTVDNKTVLDPEDDAATVNWGGSWRMPTYEEWDELINECTWTWTTQNGVNGYLVTGPNNNSIFLPAAGAYWSVFLDVPGGNGFYWSSSLVTDYPYYALDMDIYSDYPIWCDRERYYGFSVRPVSDEGVRVSVTGISINRDAIDLAVGQIMPLIATVTSSTAIQPTVLWSSSNSSVASVDYSGKVTAIREGNTIISAKAGTQVATCVITVKNASEDAINFADPIAKYACVEMFDTNQDGEVSYAEAAAATTLSGLFTDWNTVTEFDEIRYFTSVTSTEGVFNGLAQLKHITIPDNITTLGTFRSCSALETVALPAAINSIPEWCFDGCSSLKSVTLPTRISSIPGYAFRNCAALTTLDVPSTVTSVGEYAFSGCTVFTGIDMPSGVTTIGDYAFQNCKAIVSVTLPASLTYLGEYAFSGCTSLATVVLPDNMTSIPAYCFENCKSLASISWPSALQSIGDGAFYGCVISKGESDASMIELPATVKSIGSQAFWGVRHLIMPSTFAISIQSDSFIRGYTRLYVPSQMVEMYKLRTNWSAYKSQIFTISDYPVKQSSTVAEPVDLGLSVKWASWNVGASAPEEYGTYFAWGEVEESWYYDWSAYKWCNGSSSSLTKYNTNNSYGIVDNKTVLDPEDDAAHVNWGGSWRMPTEAEWGELRTECIWTEATRNGVYGYMVTGPNSNSIFLPAAGHRSGAELYDAECGRFWSSSLAYNDSAWDSSFYPYGPDYGSVIRCEGRSVRAVSE